MGDRTDWPDALTEWTDRDDEVNEDKVPWSEFLKEIRGSESRIRKDLSALDVKVERLEINEARREAASRAKASIVFSAERVVVTVGIIAALGMSLWSNL